MAEHATSEESELYALGVLDGEEKKAFEAHLHSCGDCTRGVASAHQRVALIGLACVPEMPRPAVREKIMRRIRADRAGDWTQEKTAQITELRPEREPEPVAEPKKAAEPKKISEQKKTAELLKLLEDEPEPEPLLELVTEEPSKRVGWMAAAVAVVLLAGSLIAVWAMHRSHQHAANLQAQPPQASQPAAPQSAPQAGQSDPAVAQPKPVSQQKPKAARTDANADPNAGDEDVVVTRVQQPEVLNDTAPARIASSSNDDAAPPSLAIGGDFGAGRSAAMPVLPGSAPETKVEAAPSGPTRVSSGVAAARLISPIQPVYPDLARETHTQGTVVVDAMISKTGKIKSARAVSGPAMLTGAAIAAVERARYRPFLLNGVPIEAETTITLVFRLN